MTPFDRAQRYIGEIKELPGGQDHPLIQWWLSLCGFGFDAHDEISWCSAMMNGIQWDFRLPRTKSAAARSWLDIGISKTTDEAQPGTDIAIFKRGKEPWQGHVGYFAGVEWRTDPTTSAERQFIRIVSGNVGNTVTLQGFPVADLLGIRRVE